MNLDPQQLKQAYQAFFEKSEAGKYFMSELNRMLSDNHETAEKNPETARDHMQRAKGNRQVLEHIVSVGIEIKKDNWLSRVSRKVRP